MRFLTPWALVALAPVVAVLIVSLRRRALLGRALTLALLAVALAGPEMSLRRTQETAIFLVDRSVSVGDAAETALAQFAGPVVARRGEVGVIAFAERPAVARWPGVGEIPVSYTHLTLPTN